MKVAITGASGLLGANLAIALLADGVQVRCLRRQSSKVGHLSEHDIEWVFGDLSDQAALDAACEGVDAVFHCAARVDIVAHPTEAMIEANVRGTERVISACQSQGVKRLIHCSSVVAVGISETEEPSSEDCDWNLAKFDLADGYAVTKKQSQDIVLEAAKNGMDCVVVNPCYMLGPYDARPSSGMLLLQVVKGQVPGYSGGNNNFVDVRDVAQGMIAAWKKGKAGQCYILGGYNLSYQQIMGKIADVAGVKAPSLAIPKSLALTLGFFGDIYEKVSGKEALLNATRMRWGYCKGFQFSHQRASEQLGYKTRPLEETIEDALSWFREAGML